MRKLILRTMLLTVLLALGGGGTAWAQISSWTASSGTYTAGQEITGSTAGIVTMTLGQDDGWIYDSSSRKALVTKTQQTPTFTDNIPTAGGYVVFTPTRNLNLKLRTYSSQSNCNVYMIEASNPTVKIKDFRQKDYNTNDFGTLEAGKTYYIYGGAFKAAGNATNLEYVFYQQFTATTIESYTVRFVDGNGNPIAENKTYTGLYGATVTAPAEDLTSITYNEHSYAYVSGNNGITLTNNTEDNVITLVFASASVVNYTIKYVNDSDPAVEIQDAVEVESYVGASVTASEEQIPAYITYSDVKYKYSSGNTTLEVTGNAETDVITLVYTPAAVYNYTVKALDGSANDLATVASGSYAEGDAAVTVPYSQYLLSGTTLYNIPANGSGDHYRTTFTPDANDYVVNLTYNGTAVNNVVYFSEGENIDGVNKGANAARASNGQMGYTTNNETYKEVTTLESGKYKIYVRGVNGNSTTRIINFKVGEDVVYTFNLINGTDVKGSSDEFTLIESATLYFAGDGSSASGLDWFYIQRTGDYDATDKTDLITNNSFETGDLTGWTASRTDGDTKVTTNVSPYTTEGIDGSYLFNTWNGDATGYDVTQTLTNLPAGYYKLEALFAGMVGKTVNLVANDDKTTVTHTASGTFTNVELIFALTEATDVTIGAKNANSWYKVDNFRLHTIDAAEYLAPIIAHYDEAVEAAQAINSMSSGISEASKGIVTTALANYGNVVSEDANDYTEATDKLYEAIAAAQKSIDAYNVIATGTIPTNSVAGWAISTPQGGIACNTWSTEANTDGSGMTTPFIQDHISATSGEGESIVQNTLGQGRLYYTLEGLEPGEKYNISARVRVFNENAGSLDGGSFFANTQSIDIDENGTACTGNYSNKGIFGVFSLKNIEIGEDGKLVFGIDVAEGSALNWVAIKDVTISEYAGQKVESIELSQTSATITTGMTLALTANVLPENADDKTYTWSTDNESVATVTSTGVVTALAPGSANITATANDGSGVTGSCAITVENAAAPTNYSEIAAGKFLIQNAATGKFLGQGNSWGTQASLVEHGVMATIVADGDNFKITGIVSTSNGLNVNSSNEAYVDMDPAAALTVDKQSNGAYTIALNGKFAAGKAGTTIVEINGTDANNPLAQWYFISEEAAKKNLMGATADKPADVTYYILDPNFSRNVPSNVWTMVSGNKNLSGGDNTNCNAESWHATFTLSQTLTVPNGKYKLRAQAAANGAPANVFIYANEETAPFNAIANGENSMSAMSTSFTNGLYYTDWVEVTVTDHQLTVGAKTTETGSWCIWDNFELYMIGYKPVTEIAADIDKTEIEVGQTAAISNVAITPADASFNSYTYVSSNEEVATVSAEGVVTGVAPGEATISIKAEMDEVKKDINMTVTAPAIVPEAINLAIGDESIDLEEGYTLFINKTATIAATVAPAEANQAVTYSSDAPSVVTVDENGVLTPVAYGNANITVTSAAKNDVVAVLPVTIDAPLYTELENLNFAQGPVIDNHITTYAKDMAGNGTTYSQMQPVNGWQMNVENGDAKASGIMEYGTNYGLGNNSVFAPETNPEGEASGYALGITAVWSGTAQYVQPIKLPAGEYTITIPIYRNGGTTNLMNNYIGLILDNGTQKLATNKNYTANTWTTETITFLTEEDTYGKLSLGVQQDGGGGAAQRLWIDGVNISFTSLNDLKQAVMNDISAVVIPTEKMNATVEQALSEAKQAADAGNTENTFDELKQLLANLNTAVDNANSSIDNYAAALAQLGRAATLDESGQANYAANETVTALQSAYDENSFEALTAEQTEALNAAFVAAVKAQTTAGADMTQAIINPGFELGNTTGWTYTQNGDHGAKSTSDNTYKMTNSEGDWLFNIWSAGNPITQTITGLPEGMYLLKAVAARDAGTVFLLANNNHGAIAVENKETGVEGSVKVAVSDGSLTIGAVGGKGNDYVAGGGDWYKVDNFRLTYLGNDVEQEDADALLATVPEGKMNNAVQTELDEAKTAFEGNQNASNYNRLSTAIAAANASISAYTAANTAITDANDLKDAHNFATEEATEAFANAIAAIETPYNEGTLTDEAANNAGVTLGVSRTGHHGNPGGAAVLYMNNAFNLTQGDWDTPLYVNTWSNEGETDFSGFVVPFYEYWTNDNNSLAGRTWTATLTGLPNGEYIVTTDVRVRVKNGADDESVDEQSGETVTTVAQATGLTFDVNRGTATPFVEMLPDNLILDTRFRREIVTAIGLVKDGTLTFNVNVADENNISWLAFKDMKYWKNRDLSPEEMAVAPTAIALYNGEEEVTEAITLDENTNTVTLTPKYTPEDATEGYIEWGTSDPNVVTVVDGVVTAVSSGTATVTVTSTLNAVVSATATINVNFPESDYATYSNDGATRTIYALGDNIIKNGSFDYPDNFYGWTNGAGSKLGSNGFDIVVENEENVLRAKNGSNSDNGSGSVKAIGTVWPIESGKTYVFGYKVKCSGTAQYHVVSMTNTAGTETAPLNTENERKAIKYNGSWTDQSYKFTNTEGYAYVQFKARWLSNSVYFDDFYLCEVTGDDVVVGNVDYATAAIPTANIGTDAFQYSQDAIDNANALVQDEATVKDVEDAYEALTTLNAPADGQLFNIVNVTSGFNHANKALTFKSAKGADLAANSTSMGWTEAVGSMYPQAVKFTAVDGVKNGYTMSYTRADGNEVFVATGSKSGLGNSTQQIRPTTDATKALTVVVSLAGENVWKLYNSENNNYIGSNGDTGFYTAGGSNSDVEILEAAECEISLNILKDNQYGTLMLPFEANIPEGVEAYSINETIGNTLNLEIVDSKFEANTPYVVFAEEGIEETLRGMGAAYNDAILTDGLLAGTFTDIDAPNGSYVLQNNDNRVAFYRVDTSMAKPKVRANRAYLTVPVDAADARAFYFDGSETTGINAIKALADGEALIFDANGVQQPRLTKGLNIIRTKDGRTQKVMVK